MRSRFVHPILRLIFITLFDSISIQIQVAINLFAIQTCIWLAFLLQHSNNFKLGCLSIWTQLVGFMTEWSLLTGTFWHMLEESDKGWLLRLVGLPLLALLKHLGLLTRVIWCEYTVYLACLHFTPIRLLWRGGRCHHNASFTPILLPTCEKPVNLEEEFYIC